MENQQLHVGKSSRESKFSSNILHTLALASVIGLGSCDKPIDPKPIENSTIERTRELSDPVPLFVIGFEPDNIGNNTRENIFDITDLPKVKNFYEGSITGENIKGDQYTFDSRNHNEFHQLDTNLKPNIVGKEFSIESGMQKKIFSNIIINSDYRIIEWVVKEFPDVYNTHLKSVIEKHKDDIFIATGKRPNSIIVPLIIPSKHFDGGGNGTYLRMSDGTIVIPMAFRPKSPNQKGTGEVELILSFVSFLHHEIDHILAEVDRLYVNDVNKVDNQGYVIDGSGHINNTKLESQPTHNFAASVGGPMRTDKFQTYLGIMEDGKKSSLTARNGVYGKLEEFIITNKSNIPYIKDFRKICTKHIDSMMDQIRTGKISKLVAKEINNKGGKQNLENNSQELVTIEYVFECK